GWERPAEPEKENADHSSAQDLDAAPAATPALDAVDAWQDVIVNRPSQCAACNVALARGQRAFRGLTGQSQSPAIWLCSACIEKL
ncbi:MAG TPA: hypothetical protein VM553_08355, partial [Dongiaceae bacterium]|nr:hypothetical protein [Dongiaceae bacterium]